MKKFSIYVFLVYSDVVCKVFFVVGVGMLNYEKGLSYVLFGVGM